MGTRRTERVECAHRQSSAVPIEEEQERKGVNLLSDPYRAGNRAYRTTVITTHLGPTSTHTSTATATDHEPWDASVTPSSTAAPWTASTVATFPDRVRASAPLLAHSTCTARTRGAIEHAAAMSDGQIGPLLPCARKSRALASHAHGGCVRHARARVYRVGHAPPTPPACVWHAGSSGAHL